MIADGSLRQKALSEGTTTAGGFTVAVDFHSDLFAIALGSSVFKPLATVISMPTNIVNLVSLATDWASDWYGEGDEITPQDPVFARPILTATKQASRFLVSNELLRDNLIDLLQVAARRWLEVFGRELDRVIVAGDVSGGSDEPLDGFLVDSNVTAVTMATGQNTYLK